MKYLPTIMCAALAASMAAPSYGQAPGSLKSASKLTQDAGKSDSWSYRHPTIVIRSYQRFIIQPTAVYSAPTAEWGKTTPEQRRKFAAYMTDALRKEIGTSYQIVDRPGPGVATMKLTLLGVQTTTKVAATASRMTPFGLALNGVKSIAGKPGSFSGSLQAAFELSDAQSGELIFAAVRRRSPNALDIESTLSTEKTVEAVADDIAETIRKALDKANGR